MRSTDPTLPGWVVPQMHGFRARLGRHDPGRYARASAALAAAGMAWLASVAAAVILAVIWLIPVVADGPALVSILVLVAVLVIPAGVAWLVRPWFYDHIFEVSLHAFRYSDVRGQFWSLPLSALTHAEAVGGWLIVHRHRAEPLRFEGNRVSAYELELFAWVLSKHIRDHGESVQAPPEELRALRGEPQRRGQLS